MPLIDGLLGIASKVAVNLTTKAISDKFKRPSSHENAKEYVKSLYTAILELESASKLWIEALEFIMDTEHMCERSDKFDKVEVQQYTERKIENLTCAIERMIEALDNFSNEKFLDPIQMDIFAEEICSALNMFGESRRGYVDRISAMELEKKRIIKYGQYIKSYSDIGNILRNTKRNHLLLLDAKAQLKIFIKSNYRFKDMF